MRKLVIGCGYLGERVGRKWLAAGHETWVLTRSLVRANQLAEAGFRTVVGDVLDLQSVQRLPRAETVLYSVGFDPTGRASKRDVYVGGLRNVLRELRTTTRRFMEISSTSVYGQDDGEIVNESSPVLPRTEGGCICLNAEDAVWEAFPSLSPERGVDGALILRLSGIYGPGRLLARVEQLRRGVAFKGNPDAWLNLIHVEDAVQAVLAAEILGRVGETYLVSDNRPLRRLEYFTELAARIGLPAPTFEPLSDDSLERKRLNKRCENRRVREELRVEFLYPTVSDGLRHLFGEPR
ncbi:MAG: SDR family oxidoreductase [Planctomycetaceae bacterium]